MRQGKEASVFNERTDDSSATQYFQVSLRSLDLYLMIVLVC